MSWPDYSDVVWPWDDDPHWAAPREGATSDAGDGANWVLACRECDLRFPSDIEIHVVGAHYETLHEGCEVACNLVWVGLGAPPKPSN